MKLNILLAAVLGFTSVSALAAKPVVKCSNDVTTVELFSTGAGSYRADVTVESVGGSYPTFHFRKVTQMPNPSHILGAPIKYEGEGFELTVQVDAADRPGHATVPSLGINNEELSCK